jgi:PAS domain S-box-containing protein
MTSSAGPGSHPDLAQELSRLQRELAEKTALMEALQEELVETNRGVVALYAELDDQAEQLRIASERSESKFQTLYAQAPSGIALLDNEGRIVEGNPALARLLTMVDAQVVGHKLAEYVPAEFEVRIQAFCSPVPMSMAAQEVPILRPDGSLAYTEWNVSAQIEPGLTMVVATDISQRVELEQTRLRWLDRERAARGDAEQGSRLKDDFIAVLAHELRTPLNAIMGWAQVLQRRGGSDEAMRGVAAIDRNCKTQARMIADLLDMSRLNMGKLAMAFDLVDPLQEVLAAVDAMKTTIEQKGVQVEMDVAEHYRPVRADPSRLQQVIWNLFSNAIKFSPHGSRITVQLSEQKTGLCIRVTDEGQGIDAAFLPFVFERFAQSDAASNRHRGGLGLGLAIVKQIVDAHDGTIGVHSEGAGRGTTFEVWLPVHRPVLGEDGESSGEEVGIDVDHPLANMRLLVVDDDPDALAMLRIVLVDRGAEVTVAAGADEALALLAQQRPDLVISDIGMPMTDGYEFMRRVRSDEADKASSGAAVRLPAIALTSFTRAEDREQALLAGYDAHCPKPLKPLVLVQQIAALLPASRPTH